MSKRADTTGLDPSFIISQAKRSNRELKSDPVSRPDIEIQDEPIEPEPEREQEIPNEVKDAPKRKRNQSLNYRETFLKRNEIKTRQCVYISFDVHETIVKLVRALNEAGNEISVGGYIDTVLNEHMQLHKDEINEIYRRPPCDLIK